MEEVGHDGQELNIEIIKGRSFPITINMTDKTTGSQTPFVAGDIVTFRMSNEKGGTAIITKTTTTFTDGKSTTNIVPSDTSPSTIIRGNYYYEIKLTRGTDIYTLLYGNFEIKEVS
jgi:hypothetical protein